VTFFIQTFFIRDKVYTNFLYTGQSLYGTKFIQDKVYTGTKFLRGQSLYGDKVYTGQSSYSDKVYTGTKFIQTFFILHTSIKSKMNNKVLKICNSYNQIIYSMLVLVTYHKDTFGIGRGRAYTW
jgi:hypothetical protein